MEWRAVREALNDLHWAVVRSLKKSLKNERSDLFKIFSMSNNLSFRVFRNGVT